MTSTLPAPRAIIFDWDNTLVDNWQAIADALNATLVAMGQQAWSDDEVRLRVRKSLRDSFPGMFGERWREARELFYSSIRRRHITTLKPLPGADALLRVTNQAGLYMAVVSNKQGDILRAEAAHLDWSRYFSKIVGATDAARDKPAPEPVALALEGFGGSPTQEVWFVGDAAIDMECARNAGCGAVLVGAGADVEGTTAHYRPDLRVRDCQELAAVISSFKSSIENSNM